MRAAIVLAPFLSCTAWFASPCEVVNQAKIQPTPVPIATLTTPQIFSPGIVSGPGGDGSPTFSPDGNTLFFTRSAAHWSVILESHRSGEQWSHPRLASFSGQWSDSSPAMSPDGSFLVFVSTRPMKAAAGTSAPANNTPRQMASHLWRVDRTGAGWGEPIELPPSVNFCQFLFRPSVAGDGSLYFTAAGQGKELRLFRSRRENGLYAPAEALPFSDGNLKDVDPEIAPDQSFLVFTRMESGAPHEKLFIVHNRAGVWDKVMPLRYAGDEANGSSDDNDARLGIDHRTLYFSSDRSPVVRFPRTREEANQDFERMESWDNGNTNVWYIPLAL